MARVGTARRAGTPLTPELDDTASEVGAVLDEAAAQGMILAVRLRLLADGVADVDWEGLDPIDTAILATVVCRIESNG